MHSLKRLFLLAAGPLTKWLAVLFVLQWLLQLEKQVHCSLIKWTIQCLLNKIIGRTCHAMCMPHPHCRALCSTMIQNFKVEIQEDRTTGELPHKNSNYLQTIIPLWKSKNPRADMFPWNPKTEKNYILKTFKMSGFILIPESPPLPQGCTVLCKEDAPGPKASLVRKREVKADTSIPSILACLAS